MSAFAAVRDNPRRQSARRSSAYPLDLLRAAGVDMEQKQPVTDALQVFGQYLDEMERLMEHDAL